MKRIPVITIDGPSGAGKGTIAKMLCFDLNWNILDSGALYRTLAFLLEEKEINLLNFSKKKKEIEKEFKVSFEPGRTSEPVKVILRGEDVTNSVRTEEIAVKTSILAASTEIRKFIKPCQRDFMKPPGLIADGRDMGTVIFPEADLKIYLTASIEERAKRRYSQLKRQGTKVNMRLLWKELETRDQKDMERKHSPLKPADGSYVIDTSNLNPEEVMRKIKNLQLNYKKK